MPFRAAGRGSSSWSHRRAPTYLRRSHMPLDGTYKHLPLQEWHSVASGCPLEQKVHEGPDYAIAGIAANEQRDISAAAFCCEALSRPPVVTNSWRTATDDTSHAPRPRHRRLFVRTALAFWKISELHWFKPKCQMKKEIPGASRN